MLNGGKNVYQFVHAADLAQACFAAAKRPGSSVYNIGAENFGTMSESLDALCQHAGTGSKLFSLPMKPIELLMKLTSSMGLSPLGPYHALMYGRSLYFDIDKAQKELNFQPLYSNKKMLIESYDWYLGNRKILSKKNRRLSHHRRGVKEGILKLIRYF